MKSISKIKFRWSSVAGSNKRFASPSLLLQLLHGGMSGFAIRMSAYKTVNKRADPKRNFTASLACGGYTASQKRKREGETGEIEASFGEVGETDETRTRRGRGWNGRKGGTNREIEETRGIEERK